MKRITLLTICLISFITNAQTYAIYTQDASIGTGVNSLRFQNGQGFTATQPTTAPYEGSKNYLLTYDGTSTYFFAQFLPRNVANTADTSVDLSAYSYYNIAVKTSCPNPFYIRMKGNGITTKVLIDPLSNSYGFKNDNQWYFMSIPFSAFIADPGAFSLTLITEILVIRSYDTPVITGKTNNFEVDNVFVSTRKTIASATSGNWETASTWAGGVVPTSANDVFIAAGHLVNVNATTVQCYDLSISAAGALTVKSGANLNISGKLFNNAATPAAGVVANVVIENNANLIQTATPANTGSVTVKRNSNALSRLDYTIWSSPVTNANQFLTTFSPATDSGRFYNYNVTGDTYASISSPSTTPFTKGAGYLIRMPNDAVTAPSTQTFNGQFTGVLNNGNVPVTLVWDATHPYNMVGNPYPSVIDANTFISDNSTKIETALYFWRKKNGSGSAYAVYNSLGGTTASSTSEVPNGKIQVGQGFFVAAKSAGAVATFFTNTMREAAPTSTQFFKTKQMDTQNRVWLNLTNTEGVFSQALVGYIDGATQGVDNYDGKYINDSPIALTSNIEGAEYTIQGRPAFEISDIVALNFKTNAAGTYTISKDHADGVFATGQDIYLVDATTSTETNLQTDAYTFTAASGVDNARFSLKYQKTLGINTAEFNDNSVQVYRNNGGLKVTSGANAIRSIKVYDILGRVIAEQNNVNANSATIKDLRATHQVVLVKVTSADNTVVTKKVVN